MVNGCFGSIRKVNGGESYMVAPEDILNIIRKAGPAVEIERLDYDKKLLDQGMDSLDLISTLFAIEEAYKIKVEEDDIDQGKLGSINAIVKFVNENTASAE
jgi:acyl carrier protein